MSIAEVKGGAEIDSRAGTQALTLLSIPINVHILAALADGPRSLTDLRRATGSAPPTTMRGYLRTLSETGVVTRSARNDFPGNLDFELTDAGRDLVIVTRALEAWLARAPEGPLAPGSPAAKSATKALVAAWGTNMIRALAAQPLSLTELDGIIAAVSYPSLERRLAAMRMAGQVERTSGRGGGTPYAVTTWLRLAVAPLAAAAKWERRYLRDAAAPILGRDIEAAFLLAVPLIRLAPEVSGTCRMAVELRNGNGYSLAGAMLRAEGGRVPYCVSRLEGHPEAWASGSPPAWLASVVGRDPERLEVGGDHQLASALIDGLHRVVFGKAGALPCRPRNAEVRGLTP